MGSKNKENFIYHYNLEVSNNRPPCGPGSEHSFIERSGTVTFLNTVIKKYNIKSINDCPSGLLSNWMHLVDFKDVDYVGYDINPLAVERNKKEFPAISFFEFDLVNEILPTADLIICRDCFFHLSNNFVSKGLENFRKSGTKYLLSTSHYWLGKNNELTKKELDIEAGYRHLNLEIAPYNMGSPLEIHIEGGWTPLDAGNNRQLSLWKLN